MSLLDRVDKRKCHCSIEWQHRVKWLRLVEKLNSCSWWENQEGLRGRLLNLWLLGHWIVLGEEEKIMIGARKDFFMEKNICVTLYFVFFVCFQFHIILICFQITTNVVLLHIWILKWILFGFYSLIL